MNFLHIIFLIIGYFIGSIPNALIIGRLFYKKDVRQYGSHNLGGTNAGRVLGKKIGALVIGLDVLKCTLPMIIVQLVWGMDYALCMGVIIPFGHCYPIFAQFKGGKAVASSIGFAWGTVFFNFPLTLELVVAPLLVMLVIVKLSKYVSLGSISVYGIITIISFFLLPWKFTVCYFILWLLIIYRHRANITRLIKHQETKISW